MTTKTSVADVELESYVFNASGPVCTNLEELKVIGGSASSAIMMKSATIEPREGNPEPRYAHLPHGSIQSMGLPNLGYKEYVKIAESLSKEFEKPIVASVAGFSVDDYKTMVQAFQRSKVDLIEVNLSCPNIVGKPQVAYDLEQTEAVLTAIDNLGEKPVGLKLPPFYDLSHHEQMSEVILNHNISFVSCINSVGNTLVIDSETEAPIIKPKKGYGGLSGAYIKPIALANVRAFYELMGDRVDIIGVGGIETGEDAFEFLLAGASAVQVATVFEKQGPNVFAKIDAELKDILRKRGYTSIKRARGKLKEL